MREIGYTGVIIATVLLMLVVDPDVWWRFAVAFGAIVLAYGAGVAIGLGGDE